MAVEYLNGTYEVGMEEMAVTVTLALYDNGSQIPS